ncbi:NADPH:quinone oxidoreductase 2 [Fimbriimonas ginsengisoli Gsoil 348]|uniref:NADPH:quinone oxidoreductase 2 n=1 Tax=Fimbriimonas ginsengisoli Gsoil 348 TaxID=661478 RepID=A0A068NNX9_FIMGI|nr:NADPH:quinone oxidoreductase 2 [Fimbriimonas ginsengisoli Gsoil 348]
MPASDLVALARTPSKAEGLGVNVRKADFDRPETLGPALGGVDTLLFISASEVGKRLAQHRNVIEAAKQAGVKWIIYTSLLRADASSLSLAEEHFGTEEALRASGIPITILRNGWYTENYTDQIPGALAAGALIGSAGNGRISGASRPDYADAAVAVALGTGHEGRTYELAGDGSFTLNELAAEVSRQTGRTIPYKDLPLEEYAAALASFGLPDGLAHAIASWDVGASQGALFDEGHQLSNLIGRPTTPMAVTVAETLKSLP